MTPEQINAAIAEECGWKRYEIGDGGQYGWKSPQGLRNSLWRPYYEDHELPNYCTDLNAMHEAENTISDFCKYGKELAKILNCYDPHEFPSILPANAGVIAHATAPQRCEAFLRVKGRWI